MNAGNRGLIDDANSHERGTCSPPYNDCWPPIWTECARERALASHEGNTQASRSWPRRKRPARKVPWKFLLQNTICIRLLTISSGGGAVGRETHSTQYCTRAVAGLRLPPHTGNLAKPIAASPREGESLRTVMICNQRRTPNRTRVALGAAAALLFLATAAPRPVNAEQPPAPCHPNPLAAQDEATVRNRGDIVNVPTPLKDRLARLANRPHSQLPTQVYNEADKPSRLFQYYLLDTNGFQPNVFTKIFPGVNDHVQLTVTGANCGLPTVGAVRVVLEPKPGLPTDPNNPRAFNDVFTDISPLFVINNESGWYEGWMIHDITVPAVNPIPRQDGHAQFGAILPEDAEILKNMGTGHNVSGAIFTVDGMPVHFPSASDNFPNQQTNVVPIYLSMGAYNSLQHSDTHPYWEFNYQGTNRVHPL